MPSGFPGGDPTPSAFPPTGGNEPEDEWLGGLQDDTEITVNRSDDDGNKIAPRHDGPAADRLCVDGLSGSAVADDLFAEFGRYGRVVSVRMAPSETRRLPGHRDTHRAVVRFDCAAAVDRAMASQPAGRVSFRVYRRTH